MKTRKTLLAILVAAIAFQSSACGKSVLPTTTPLPPTATPIPRTATPVPPTETPMLPTQTPLPPSMILQEGNNLPRNLLQMQPISELANNRIGDVFPIDSMSCPEPDQGNWSFAHVGNLGLKWVRLSLDRMDSSQAQSMGLYSQFKVNECQDKLISWLVEDNVTIMYTIVFWDETLQVGENYPRYHNEEEIQRYLDYARFIVRHFKGKIKYYEILNEPLHGEPQQHVELNDYVNLIRRVAPVIREEDPDAKIVVGGATDLRHKWSYDYLFGVLESDIMPLVDAIGLHPMYGASPHYEEIEQYYYDYPAMIQTIKDTAIARGFNGEYIAEEMCWRTAINPNPYEPGGYTETIAAKYYARGIVINLGLDVWAGIGGERYDEIPPIANVVQNLSVTMAGTRPESLPLTIQSEAKNIVDYTFLLNNEGYLVTLWTDGMAVDDDSGVTATLAISGFAEWNASAIDVLHGFEQPLNTSNENGNLIISNLLIKDYPIIIRLSK